MNLRLLIRRPAVRTLTAEDVPDDVLRAVVDDARWTGSARNGQPWRFVALRDAELRRALSRLGAYAAHLADAPVVLVVLSPAEARWDSEFDVGRVVQSLTLAAAERGLGTCPVSLYPEDNALLAAELVGADAGWTARHALTLGHAAPPRFTGPSAIPRGRLAVDELLRVL